MFPRNQIHIQLNSNSKNVLLQNIILKELQFLSTKRENVNVFIDNEHKLMGSMFMGNVSSSFPPKYSDRNV